MRIGINGDKKPLAHPIFRVKKIHFVMNANQMSQLRALNANELTKCQMKY